MITRRADGRARKKIRIEGRDKYFYSSLKNDKAAERDIERQIDEYLEKEERKRHVFSELLAAMLEEKEQYAEINTVLCYKAAAKHLEPLYDYYIEEIRPERFRSLINGMVQQRYSASTISKVKIVANMVIEYAELEYGLQITNFTKVKTNKPRKSPSKRPLTDEQIGKVIAGADKPFGMFAFILMTAGLRTEEVLAVQKRDIDFTNRVVHITKAVITPSNQPIIKETKTEQSNRDVPIMPILFDRLKEYCKGLKDTDYIIGGSPTPITRTQKIKRWKRYCRENGLDGIAPHLLRHTFAFICYRSGTDAKTTQGLIGHSNIATTMNTYTAFSKQMSQDAISKANDLYSELT